VSTGLKDGGNAFADEGEFHNRWDSLVARGLPAWGASRRCQQSSAPS